jgi:hypothetical protein
MQRGKKLGSTRCVTIYVHKDNDLWMVLEKHTENFFTKIKIDIKFSDMVADNIFAHAPLKSFINKILV